MKLHRFAALYFLLQGAGVIAWWILLLTVPSFRLLFQFGDDDTSLWAFSLPDLVFLGTGSIVAGMLCLRNSQFVPIALWCVAGSVSYATFYTLSLAFITDSGWLGVLLMFLAFIWSGTLAMALSPALKPFLFRNSTEAKTQWLLTKTFTQIVVVWGVILFILPSQIVSLELKLGLSQFAFPFQKSISGFLFCGLSFLGVSAAVTMTTVGRGTPLPMDSARRLVIRGLYGFVRNPMAISGVGQALAVGLFLGSPLVLMYAVMGGMIWQIVFRPLEEEDLEARFGTEYARYKREVPCWVPRRRPFRA